MKHPELGTHREFVGNPSRFDIIGGGNFALFLALGMRESHRFLDVGCGSLRSGRFVLQYLLPGHYFGIEPNLWLVGAAFQDEIGLDALRTKRPTFDDRDDLSLEAFGQTFDFVHAHSILTHAPLSMVTRFVEEVAVTLEPDGICVATFEESLTDHQGSRWSYPDVVGYRWESIESEASAVDLVAHRFAWPHARQTYFILARSESAFARAESTYFSSAIPLRFT